MWKAGGSRKVKGFNLFAVVLSRLRHLDTIRLTPGQMSCGHGTRSLVWARSLKSTRFPLSWPFCPTSLERLFILISQAFADVSVPRSNTRDPHGDKELPKTNTPHSWLSGAGISGRESAGTHFCHSPVSKWTNNVRSMAPFQS